MRCRPSAGLPPIIPSESVSTKKDKIRDGLKWLSYKGKLSLKSFGSRDNLKPREESKPKNTRKKLDFSMT